MLGVFLGSALWWLLLSTGVGMLRGRIDQIGLSWVNRVSGVLIVAFGFYALSGLICGHLEDSPAQARNQSA